MRLLLDTCTFLWVALDHAQLSATARKEFLDPANAIYLSAASAWEIGIKYVLGRMPLPSPPNQLVPRLRIQHRITDLAIDEKDALNVSMLPSLHKDPFDRMIVAQAVVRGMTVLTPDPLIRQYGVPANW